MADASSPIIKNFGDIAFAADIAYEYGRFRLRRPLPPPFHLPDPSLRPLFDDIMERNLRWGIFLLLGPGEVLKGLTMESTLSEGDEAFITSVAPRTTDLPRVLAQVYMWLERERKFLPAQQAYLEDLKADLRRQESGATAPGEAEPSDEHDTYSLADQIAWADWTIASLEALSAFAKQALAEVEAQHPEIDIAAQVEVYRQERNTP
jgi:hypothetical protein